MSKNGFCQIFTKIRLNGSSFKIRSVELDHKQNGSPIVFLPGINGFAESYLWNLTMISKNGYAPYAVDHLGFGGSDKPPSFDLGLDTFAIAISKWIRKRKLEKVVIVGNSMGGGVAMRTWEMIPDKVNGIILVSAAGFGKELMFNYRLASVPYLSDLILFIVLNKFFTVNNGRRSWKAIVYDHLKLPDLFIKISDKYKDDYETRHAYQYLLKNFVTINGQSHFATQYMAQISKKVKANKVPVLVIWGNNDKVIPKEHGKTASRLTGGDLVIFDECGHMPYVEHIDQFNNQIIKFMKNNFAN